jgi:hypothetical protein
MPVAHWLHFDRMIPDTPFAAQSGNITWRLPAANAANQ